MMSLSSEFQPNSQEELGEFLANNETHERAQLTLMGGGTSARRHADSKAVSIDTTRLNRVIDYPARDMTITVEVGIRIAELNSLLATEHQRLPIDVPQADRATLGGVIATNWSGSRRFGCGTMRDYLIGVSALDASGRSFKAGGRVVKNVAGYDICKLLIGSRGTLAAITQATLKLRPIPESSGLARVTFGSWSSLDEFLESLLTSATRPVVLDVVAHPGQHPQLIVGFEGSALETAWQLNQLRAESVRFQPTASTSLMDEQANSLWNELRDFCLAPAFAVFKASLPPSRTIEFARQATEARVTVQAHAGNGIVLGRLPGTVTSASQAASVVQSLQELASECGGHFSVIAGSAECPNLETSRSRFATSLAWSERVRAELDPQQRWLPASR